MQIEEIDTFKKSSLPYALDIGSQFFEIGIPENKKDLLLNQAVKNAYDELSKLKEIVEVAQKQALDIKKRLEVTHLIHNAKYNFEPTVGVNYWLVHHKLQNNNILSNTGPDDWSFGKPDYYEYVAKVQYLANGLWSLIEDK